MLPLLVRCRFVVQQCLTILTWVVERGDPEGPSPSMMALNRPQAGEEDNLLQAREVPDPIPGMPLVEPVLDKGKDLEIPGLCGKTRRQGRIDQATIGQRPRSLVLE